MDETKQEIYKTINQLSKEYGLTKNGMSVRVKKMTAEVKRLGLNESDYITRGKQNTVYIMPKGLEWLANWNENNTPMQEPTRNIELELYKLEQAEQRVSDLEGQLLDMKQLIDHLESENRDKSSTINKLTDTIQEQTNLIKFKESQILALTEKKEPESNQAPEPEPTPEQTATETDNAKNAQNAPKTAFSISDEQITTELSKRGFMGKLKLLFGH